MDLSNVARQIVEQIKGAPDPTLGWKEMLSIVGKPQLTVTVAQVREDIESVKRQVASILKGERFAKNTTFLYFGIFDAVVNAATGERTGLYLAGGSGAEPEKQLSEGNLSYMPNNRFLESILLQKIRDAARVPDNDQALFEYAITLGAAAILSKEAAIASSICLPVFVGFDSGDFFRILN